MASRFEGAFTAYRIVRTGLPAFDGSGAFRWGGRWTSPGRYIVHAAESYSLALLDNLVHFNLGEVPPHLSVTPLEIPADVSRAVLRGPDVPGWEAPSPYGVSRQYGDAWYDERRSLVLVVPSVLSPFECNILINQQHSEATRIRVGEPVRAALDDRLRALLGGGAARKS